MEIAHEPSRSVKAAVAYLPSLLAAEALAADLSSLIEIISALILVLLFIALLFAAVPAFTAALLLVALLGVVLLLTDLDVFFTILP